MLSNLAKAAGWVKMRDRPGIAGFMFGWKPADVPGMTVEEYCARGLGRFCETAARAVGDMCRVIDYHSLDVRHIRQVADFFGVTLPSADSFEFQKVLGTYAKDPKGARRFEGDGERKRREAPEAVKRAAQRWAQAPYEALRELEAW